MQVWPFSSSRSSVSLTLYPQKYLKTLLLLLFPLRCCDCVSVSVCCNLTKAALDKPSLPPHPPVLPANIVIHHAVFHWVPPDTMIPCSHPQYQASSCLSELTPSVPSSSHSPSSPHHTASFPHSVCHPPSIPPICAPSPPPSCPLNLSHFLSPLPFPLPSVYSHFLGSSHPGSQGRDGKLSLRVGDPCQGGKLPTTACLHSWKIKDLWRREGSECLYVCMYVRDRVREVLIDQSACGKKEVQIDRCMCATALRVCLVFVCVLICGCVCVIR